MWGDDEGSPIMTVFRESKEEHEEFEQIFPDTRMLWFKLLEPGFETDPTFIYRFVQPTAQIQNLIEEIKCNVPELEAMDEVKVHVEIGPNSIKDITNKQSTVQQVRFVNILTKCSIVFLQCGLDSGAIILMGSVPAIE